MDKKSKASEEQKRSLDTLPKKKENGIVTTDNRSHETRITEKLPGKEPVKDLNSKEEPGVYFTRTNLISPYKLAVGKTPVCTIFYSCGDPVCHVTMVFTAVGITEIHALRKMWAWLSRDYPKIKVKVLKTSPFKDRQRPENNVRDVKLSKVPKSVLTACSKLSRYEVVPHISFKPGQVEKIKGEIEMQLNFSAMYATAKFKATDLVSDYIGIPKDVKVAFMDTPSTPISGSESKPTPDQKGESNSKVK